MKPGFSSCFAAVLTALATLATLPAPAQTNQGPQGPEQGRDRRQLWLIPAQDKTILMRANVFRPPGPGPFPLVVINHGSVQTAEQRAKLPVPVFATASEFFVARGYAVVLPQRPGHGETGGRYFETNSLQGGCDNADYRKSGLAAADSIVAATEFMIRQPFIKPDGVVVVGQSAGGWASLALASRNPRNIRAVINFAGGRGGRVNDRPNNNCAPDKLVEAAGSFGATARIPVLSIYTQNDTFFSPDLSKRLNEAYRAKGGKVDYRLLSAFKNDGHRLFGDRDGVEIWGPIVDEFLKSVK
jgi:dienelactone hydrolase